MSIFGTPTSSGNIFGAATTSTPTSGGIFGNKPTTSAPTSGGIFGNTTTASTAPATGGIFGSTPAATQLASGGLFGNATSTPASKPGGLFGNTATTSAPATGGGLFGNTGATSQPATGSGLFGSAPATATPQPATGGGLFGSGANTQQNTTGGGLFGTQQPQQNAGGGIFGASTAQQPQQTPTLNTGGGLFASPTTQQNSGPFGAPASHQNSAPNIFGSTLNQQNLQQNQVSAATVDVSKLMPTTRFGDCHQSVQQDLESVEKEIQEQITLSCSLADRFPAHRTNLETIPTDANVLEHRLATIKSFQLSDQAAYEQVRAHQDADSDNSTLSIRNLDLFRLPHAQRSQFVQRSSNYATPQRENEITSNRPMITYFNKQADEFDRKLQIINRSVREVEKSLKSVEAQALIGASGLGVNGSDLTSVTGGVSGRQDAKRLNRTLWEFNEALKDVSGRIVDAREGLLSVTGRR